MTLSTPGAVLDRADALESLWDDEVPVRLLLVDTDEDAPLADTLCVGKPRVGQELVFEIERRGLTRYVIDERKRWMFRVPQAVRADVGALVIATVATPVERYRPPT